MNNSDKENTYNNTTKNEYNQAPNPINNVLTKDKNKKGHYILGKVLGEGAFGKVKKATHIYTNQTVAIKILNKQKIIEDDDDKKRVEEEIKILKKLKHKNIIQLYEIMENNKYIYLVMEYCENKELFDYIVKRQNLSELEACKFFNEIIEGIEYLHNLKIVHRDLKPENLLLDFNYNIKISDFGLSKNYKSLYNDNKLLSTPCGTPIYAPPEMLSGNDYNGLKSDIWSSGIILYGMLCGSLPYCDSREDVILKKIVDKEYVIPQNISELAKDFLIRLLNEEPNQRLNIDRIRIHPWFNIYNCYIYSYNISKNILSTFNNNIESNIERNDVSTINDFNKKAKISVHELNNINLNNEELIDLIKATLNTNCKIIDNNCDDIDYKYGYISKLQKLNKIKCKTLGFYNGYHKLPIDEEILSEVEQFGLEKNMVKEHLLLNKFSSITSVYYLCLKKNILEGKESISDLSSKKYIEYIKNNIINKDLNIEDFLNEGYDVNKNKETNNCDNYKSFDNYINEFNKEYFQQKKLVNNKQNRIKNDSCNSNNNSSSNNNNTESYIKKSQDSEVKNISLNLISKTNEEDEVTDYEAIQNKLLNSLTKKTKRKNSSDNDKNKKIEKSNIDKTKCHKNSDSNNNSKEKKVFIDKLEVDYSPSINKNNVIKKDNPIISTVKDNNNLNIKTSELKNKNESKNKEAIMKINKRHSSLYKNIKPNKPNLKINVDNQCSANIINCINTVFPNSNRNPKVINMATSLTDIAPNSINNGTSSNNGVVFNLNKNDIVITNNNNVKTKAKSNSETTNNNFDINKINKESNKYNPIINKNKSNNKVKKILANNIVTNSITDEFKTILNNTNNTNSNSKLNSMSNRIKKLSDKSNKNNTNIVITNKLWSKDNNTNKNLGKSLGNNYNNNNNNNKVLNKNNNNFFNKYTGISTTYNTNNSKQIPSTNVINEKNIILQNNNNNNNNNNTDLNNYKNNKYTTNDSNMHSSKTKLNKLLNDKFKNHQKQAMSHQQNNTLYKNIQATGNNNNSQISGVQASGKKDVNIADVNINVNINSNSNINTSNYNNYNSNLLDKKSYNNNINKFNNTSKVKTNNNYKQHKTVSMTIEKEVIEKSSKSILESIARKLMRNIDTLNINSNIATNLSNLDDSKLELEDIKINKDECNNLKNLNFNSVKSIHNSFNELNSNSCTTERLINDKNFNNEAKFVEMINIMNKGYFPFFEATKNKYKDSELFKDEESLSIDDSIVLKSDNIKSVNDKNDLAYTSTSNIDIISTINNSNNNINNNSSTKQNKIYLSNKDNTCNTKAIKNNQSVNSNNSNINKLSSLNTNKSININNKLTRKPKIIDFKKKNLNRINKINNLSTSKLINNNNTSNINNTKQFNLNINRNPNNCASTSAVKNKLNTSPSITKEYVDNISNNNSNYIANLNNKVNKFKNKDNYFFNNEYKVESSVEKSSSKSIVNRNYNYSPDCNFYIKFDKDHNINNTNLQDCLINNNNGSFVNNINYYNNIVKRQNIEVISEDEELDHYHSIYTINNKFKKKESLSIINNNNNNKKSKEKFNSGTFISNNNTITNYNKFALFKKSIVKSNKPEKRVVINLENNLNFNKSTNLENNNDYNINNNNSLSIDKLNNNNSTTNTNNNNNNCSNNITKSIKNKSQFVNKSSSNFLVNTSNSTNSNIMQSISNYNKANNTLNNNNSNTNIKCSYNTKNSENNYTNKNSSLKISNKNLNPFINKEAVITCNKKIRKSFINQKNQTCNNNNNNNNSNNTIKKNLECLSKSTNLIKNVKTNNNILNTNDTNKFNIQNNLPKNIINNSLSNNDNSNYSNKKNNSNINEVNKSVTSINKIKDKEIKDIKSKLLSKKCHRKTFSAVEFNKIFNNDTKISLSKKLMANFNNLKIDKGSNNKLKHIITKVNNTSYLDYNNNNNNDNNNVSNKSNLNTLNLNFNLNLNLNINNSKDNESINIIDKNYKESYLIEYKDLMIYKGVVNLDYLLKFRNNIIEFFMINFYKKGIKFNYDSYKYSFNCFVVNSSNSLISCNNSNNKDISFEICLYKTNFKDIVYLKLSIMKCCKDISQCKLIIDDIISTYKK